MADMSNTLHCIGFFCGPKIYEFEGWQFELFPTGAAWPLKANGDLRLNAGDKFYDMFERFNKLSVDEKKEYRIGGGCRRFIA